MIKNKRFLALIFSLGCFIPKSISAHGFLLGPTIKYGAVALLSNNKYLKKEGGPTFGKNLQMGLNLGWMYRKNRFLSYGVICECNYSYERLAIYDITISKLTGDLPKELIEKIKTHGKYGLKHILNREKLANVRFNSVNIPIYFKFYTIGFLLMVGPRFAYIIKRYEKLKRYRQFLDESKTYNNVKIDIDLKIGSAFNFFGVEPAFYMSTSFLNFFLKKENRITVTYKSYVPVLSFLFEFSWNPLYLIPKRKKGFKDRLRRTQKKGRVLPRKDTTSEPIRRNDP